MTGVMKKMRCTVLLYLFNQRSPQYFRREFISLHVYLCVQFLFTGAREHQQHAAYVSWKEFHPFKGDGISDMTKEHILAGVTGTGLNIDMQQGCEDD